MPNFLRGKESPEEFVKAMIRAHKSIKKVKVPIDKLDDRPWDIVQAFRDLNQRLVMADFCQNNIDYEDIQPDHVVVSHDT